MKKVTGVLLAGVLLCGTVRATEEVKSDVFPEEPYTVIVTAGRYTETEQSVPLDTIAYTEEQLEATGAANVAEALRFMPGIITSGMGNHDQSWITSSNEVMLRGVQGGTLVLLNGVPVNFNGIAHLDMIPLSAIERVETVKGSGSIMYGSSAYGGVVNVITKKSFDNTVHAKVGSNGRYLLGGTIDAGPVGIILQQDRSHGMLPSTKGVAGTRRVPDASGAIQVTSFDTAFGKSRKNMFGMTYEISSELSALYLHTQKKYSTEYVRDDDNSRAIQHFDYDDREDFLMLNYTKDGWDADAYYQKRSIRNPDYYIVNPGVREWERSRQNVYGFDVSKKWRGTANDFTAGASVRHETYENTNRKFTSFGLATSGVNAVANFGPYDLNDYAAYGQWRHYFNDRLESVVSIRAEKISGDNTSISKILPQYQLLYRLDRHSSLYVNAGKTFRMPTFRNLYYSSGALLANPDLEPESGWNYEVGYKHLGKATELRIALFKLNLDNQIATRSVNGRTQAYNAAAYRNVGLDISYMKTFDNGRYYRVGGIIHKPERKDTPTAQWKDVLGRYQLSATVGYRSSKWDVAVSTIYFGKRVYYSTQRAKDAMWQTNIHSAYRVNDSLELTFDINNLFDRDDITNSDNGNIDYLVGERALIVGANYTF